MLSTMSTTHHSPPNLYSLSPQWHVKQKNASFPRRLGMRSLKLFVMTTAMFVLPLLINRVVQSLDSLHELMGRRAQSPFVDTVPWASVFVAMVLLLGWHVCLGRLSYLVVLEEEEEEKKKERGRELTKNHREEIEERLSWGSVLGKVGMPLLMLVYGCCLVHTVVSRLKSPLPPVAWETAAQDAEFEAARREL